MIDPLLFPGIVLNNITSVEWTGYIKRYNGLLYTLRTVRHDTYTWENQQVPIKSC